MGMEAKPALSYVTAGPGNLLEMPALWPNPDLVNQKRWGPGAAFCFMESSGSSLNHENHGATVTLMGSS